jgi:aldose 1-epimerase
MSQFQIRESRTERETLIEVQNQGDMSIVLSSFGAGLRSCVRQGRELTLGHADPALYASSKLCLAATHGRWANRIAGGRCQAGGHPVTLECNNGPNHHNGGVQGFRLRNWTAEPVETRLQSGDRGWVEAAGAAFTLESPAGDQGYPGTLKARATILLSADNQLVFRHEAWTDAATPLNLANHSYWNLSGVPGSTVHDHWLRLSAKGWLEVDAFSIPTGRLRPLQYSAWDFSQDRCLALVLSDPAARGLGGFTRGIDHCFMVDPALPPLDFAVDGDDGLGLRFAGRLSAPGSTSMEFFTSRPGILVYTGNFLDGQYGRAGRIPLHGGVCLDPMHFPDSPNQGPVFRSLGKRHGWLEEDMNSWDGILQPGHHWREMTVHRFT